MFFLLVVNFLSLGLKSVFATEVSEAESTDNITVTPFAMKPTTIYIGFQNIYFTGNSAPATMYYQTSRYGAIYRGYLTRDYSYPIIWRTGKNYTSYYGTLYRNDLPLPIPASIIIPENGETPVSIQTRASSKVINYTITIRKGASIPDYYWYDNGQFRGNLKLVGWEDYSEHPTIKGCICTYRGTIYNGATPSTRALDPTVE